MRSSGLSRSHSSNTSSVYALYLRMSLRMPAGLPAAVSSLFCFNVCSTGSAVFFRSVG